MKEVTAREVEAALLARCSFVAREPSQTAQNQREANVFRLASMVVRSEFPSESQGLLRASEEYFDSHPAERLEPSYVVNKGWVSNLPRLRDMLSQTLKGQCCIFLCSVDT